MWPDFTEITGANSSVAIMETLEISEPKAVEELVVTPFRVRHTVPTVGFVVSDSNSAILYSADTRDILAVVEQAERTSGLKLAIVEASFPNELKQWAHKTGHLVPSDLVPLVSALGNDVPMRLFHMKPRYVDEIARDAAKLSGDVALLAQDEVVRI
jgi:ribonuclease BN (tRNA processing enzyme)